MNSHFMRYPSSPKWLYNVFNPVVVMITLAAAVIIAGKILNIDHALVAMITFITSWITYRRHTTYRLFVGHGIGRSPGALGTVPEREVVGSGGNGNRLSDGRVAAGPGVKGNRIVARVRVRAPD